MTGLRTHRGVDGEEFARRFETNLLETNAGLIERLRANGLIKRHGARLIPTLDGLAVADSLAAMFRL